MGSSGGGGGGGGLNSGGWLWGEGYFWLGEEEAGRWERSLYKLEAELCRRFPVP